MLYQIVLDVWEGQLDVNEAELLKGGIAGLIIRLNDMAGGHHLDTGFAAQWKQAGDAGLLRAPYFVYNPYVDGAANFTWLAANCPDTATVCIDIEVRRDGYDPGAYAAQVASFMSRATHQWAHVVIYTGPWFVPYLSYWPVNVEYWWARYPFVMYPNLRETWSWDKLKQQVAALSWPTGAPGKITLWQCSGDRIVLPGTVRAVDINLFNGSLDSLRAWFGELPPPPPVTLEDRVAELEEWVAKVAPIIGIPV